MTDEGAVESDSEEEFIRKLSRNDPGDLVEEYKQVSEEARYRDGLMHNSYYLLVIAGVLLLGAFRVLFTPRFLAVYLVGGGLLGIGVFTVMYQYNRKRVWAENRRKDVERALNRATNGEEGAPPFAIQQYVIDGELPRHWREQVASRDPEEIDPDLGRLIARPIAEHAETAIKASKIAVVAGVLYWLLIGIDYVRIQIRELAEPVIRALF